MTKETKRKYIILVGVTVLISVLALIGSTYAVLKMTVNGTKQVTMTAGILKVDFKDGNFVNLTNAAPTPDSIALKGEPYTFTITNSGNIDAYYHISLEEDSANTLNNKYIKMRLTGDNYDSGVVSVNSLGSGTFEIFKEKKINPTVSATYKLWLWLDENADNSVQGTTYKSKVVVESFDRTQKTGKLATILTKNLTSSSIDTTDSEQTFITGVNPNNYIWYSGKMWRAVSIDPTDNSVKAITNNNISVIPCSNTSVFSGGYLDAWLNDTSVDGFLGNLRDYTSFIKTDGVFNATLATTGDKPSKTTMVTRAVGLLNTYEYTMSYKGASSKTGYLNNGLSWFLITPYDANNKITMVSYDGSVTSTYTDGQGIRPVVNFKGDLKVVSGDGTKSSPYRLKGDNDTSLNGVKLNTRYSGEYVSFGTGANNLYQIVSHEVTGTTKITSVQPLTDITYAYDSALYSTSTAFGSFLNNEFLTSYLETGQSNMIVDSSTWYLGKVSYNDYRLAKYDDVVNKTLTTSTVTAKVGLLRLGELGASIGESMYISPFTTLTAINDETMNYIDPSDWLTENAVGENMEVRPAMFLKDTVTIASGTGTKDDPFVLSN